MKKNCLIIQASQRSILIAAIVAIREELQTLDFDDVIVIDLKKDALKLNLEAYDSVYVIDPSNNFYKYDLDKFIVLNHSRIKLFFGCNKISGDNKHVLRLLIGANLKTCSVSSYCTGLGLEKADKCFPLEMALTGLTKKSFPTPLSRRIKVALAAGKEKEINKEILLKLLFMELISGQVNLEIEGLLSAFALRKSEKQNSQTFLIDHPGIGSVKVVIPLRGTPIYHFYGNKDGQGAIAIALEDGYFELILSTKLKIKLKDGDIPGEKKGCHYIIKKEFLFPTD